ncbi:formate dehydrogenase [Futiania mangrovi]|uniref:Formate dehydrogenase n=1 Tax=Futiania mangrovi TaxID=2959716 RepID=A0A9J6P9B2_9PROT|nr:formate dehydrogenase [Futiania mangrovii]MCP1335413.1 formate dehydrogenase [Futiania mangrovii]
MSDKDGTSGGIARRDLLKLGTLGAVAAGAATALGSVQAGAAETAPAKGAGYRETGHVKTFYDLARF